MFRQGATPQNDNLSNFRFYPGTGYFTGAANLNSISASTSNADKYLFLWTNRCQGQSSGTCGHNQNGNPPVVDGHRFNFSSFPAALACTRAQLYQALGAEHSANVTIANNNLAAMYPTDVANGDLTSFPKANYGNHAAFDNVCYLWADSIQFDIDGVVIDYEPQDSRTTSNTNLATTYFRNFINTINNRHNLSLELVLWTNPLNGAVMPFNGIDSNNADDVAAQYDRVSILIWHDDPVGTIANDMDAQLGIYGPTVPASKVYVLTMIGQMSMAQVAETRQAALSRNLSGFGILNNTSDTACGSGYQDRISCIVNGGNACN